MFLPASSRHGTASASRNDHMIPPGRPRGFIRRTDPNNPIYMSPAWLFCIFRFCVFSPRVGPVLFSFFLRPLYPSPVRSTALHCMVWFGRWRPVGQSVGWSVCWLVVRVGLVEAAGYGSSEAVFSRLGSTREEGRSVLYFGLVGQLGWLVLHFTTHAAAAYLGCFSFWRFCCPQPGPVILERLDS